MDNDMATPPPRADYRKFILLLLPWLLLAVPTGSFLYACAAYHLAWVSIGLFVLFVFAFLNGYVVAAVAARCGNIPSKVMFGTAFLFGIIALYLSWVAWIWMLNAYWSVGLIFDPIRQLRVIGFLAEDDFRLMGDRRVPAWEWYSYWLLEMLTLVFVPVSVVRSALLKKRKRCSPSPENAAGKCHPSPR